MYGEDDEELTNVLVWVDDPHMYPIYGVQADGPEAYYRDYRIGAIAVDVSVFDSVEQWRQTQTPISTKNSTARSMVDNFPEEPDGTHSLNDAFAATYGSSSGCRGKFAGHVLIEADALFCRFDRQAAVEILAQAELELS